MRGKQARPFNQPTRKKRRVRRAIKALQKPLQPDKKGDEEIGDEGNNGRSEDINLDDTTYDCLDLLDD